MGYELIPFMTALILGIHHALDTSASRRSRAMVGVIVAVSLVLWWRYPRLFILALLLQAGVSIYVLLYIKLTQASR